MPDLNLPAALARPSEPHRPVTGAAIRVARDVLSTGGRSARITTAAAATGASLKALTRLADLVAVPAEEGSDQIVAALQMVCGLIPGAHWATLSAGNPSGTLHTLHATHSRARTADELQFTLQEGPTVDVVRHRRQVLADTISTDPRWPRFAQLITARTPVGAVLSVPVDIVQPGHGALTLYGGTDHNFTDDATTAAVAVVGTALAGLAQRERAAGLHRTLLSNRRIGVAIGILMAQHHWPENQALQALTAAGQAAGRAISELAAEIARTGALPTAP